jgi:uncharacterized protein (TIGR01777 family)
MRVRAWPFLVGRSRVFGYRPIVVPQFLLEHNASALLAGAVRGDLSDPNTATYREIHGSVAGDLSLVFRVIQAQRRHIGLAGDEPLRDGVGRVILLLEGIVLEGRRRDIVITKGDLQVAHEQVEQAYREFWHATSQVPAVRPSLPFYLEAESNTHEQVDLRWESALELTREEPKRVIVTGATGLIGQALCKQLQERGYIVVVFSRDLSAARTRVPGAAAYIAWDPSATEAWAAAIDGAYAVVSLVGEPTESRDHSERYWRLWRESRIVDTRGLVAAMAYTQVKPKIFVRGSAVSYYGYEGFTDRLMDESAPSGRDFWGQSTSELEEEAARAEALGIRTVLVRTSMVLDAHEGLLSRLIVRFRRFLGGPILPGTQWFPWIHIADEVGILLLALEDERVRGPINAAIPQSQRYRDFAMTLGRVLGRPCWLPLPGFVLKRAMGEAADMIIHGRRVIPQKALELGYQFQYPTSEQALRQLLSEEERMGRRK